MSLRNEIDYELRTTMTNAICVMGAGLSSALLDIDGSSGLSKKQMRKHLAKIHKELIVIQDSKNKVLEMIR